jgi:hypothetical protein
MPPVNYLVLTRDGGVPREHIKRTHSPERLCPNCPHVFHGWFSSTDLAVSRQAHTCEKGKAPTPHEEGVRQLCLSPDEHAEYKKWMEHRTRLGLGQTLSDSFRAICVALLVALREGGTLTELRASWVHAPSPLLSG